MPSHTYPPPAGKSSGSLKRPLEEQNTVGRPGRAKARPNSDAESQHPRSLTGNFGSALSRIQTTCQDWHVIGKIPTETSDPLLLQTLQHISKFLTQHQLVEAASRSNPSAATENRGDTPISIVSYYLPTLNEFSQAQSERQTAGLRTNANQESASGLSRLVAAHSKALRGILSTTSDGVSSILASTQICSVHANLCPSHPQSGRFRSNQARAGNTLFCPPEEIQKEMTLVWLGIRNLHHKWFIDINPNNPTNNSGFPSEDMSHLYHGIALAVIAMYAINDVHPFADGNGRTSRIYANGLLKRLLKLPFSITIAATPQQRKEYIDGLRYGQGWIKRLDKGGVAVATSASVSTGKNLGALKPLIRMLIERIGHAVVQVQSLLTEQARMLLDQEEARIARIVRERAAQGQCLICLDPNPNIATLCCGQAVHLNCIAEWLANGTSCVSCRNPLPRLSVARQEQQQQQQQEPTRDDPQAMQNVVQQALSMENRADSTAHEAEALIDYESTTYFEAAPVQPRPPRCPTCQNRSAIDCGNQMCGRCCMAQGQAYCGRHGCPGPVSEDTTTAGIASSDDNVETEDVEDTTEDTTEVFANSHHQDELPQCSICNNRAATNCPNGMCGRCCVSDGRSHCSRHTPIHEDTTSSAEPNQSTTDDSTGDVGRQDQSTRFQIVYCYSCGTNRAAQGCFNTMCGRCCLLSGNSAMCGRHC